MNVDEIVAALGKAMATGHLPEDLSSALAVLIAGWRKRGEALKDARPYVHSFARYNNDKRAASVLEDIDEAIK